MRVSVKLVFLTGLALGATPALAFTYVPSSATPSGQQFADPDAALESTASTLCDEVVTNNLRAHGGPLADGAANFNPPSQGYYGYGSLTRPSQYPEGAPVESGVLMGDYGSSSVPFIVTPHP